MSSTIMVVGTEWLGKDKSKMKNCQHWVPILLLLIVAREEADELCRTLEENEENPRTASEMADVLYHAMLLLGLREVKVEEILQVLRHRFHNQALRKRAVAKHKKANHSSFSVEFQSRNKMDNIHIVLKDLDDSLKYASQDVGIFNCMSAKVDSS